jgi:lipopolysaccharide export system permease protein
LKTLHLYLLRQITGSLVMTMLVFTFVLLVGSALKEILPLLVNGEASFYVVAKAFALLVPFVFAFALPMAMLTSTLLVFGRFSADQELTAARASGISLLSLASPILVLGLLMCGVSAVLNLQIAPKCRVAYNDLRSDMKASLAEFKLPEGQYVDFPSQTNGNSFSVYVRKNRDQHLQDVRIYKIERDTNITTITAPEGHVEVDTNTQRLLLYLTNASVLLPEGRPFSGTEWFQPVDLSANGKSSISISDMTFQELREELKKPRTVKPPPLDTKSQDPARKKKRPSSGSAMGDVSQMILVLMHKQMAFSFACFGFTLVGIPLGIRVHRRETNVGVFIALALVGVYYTIQVTAQSLTAHPEYAPHLLMWVPNLIFQAVGAVLLWRANRGI